MKKPPDGRPAAFSDRFVAGGNDREISRNPVQKQAASERAISELIDACEPLWRRVSDDQLRRPAPAWQANDTTTSRAGREVYRRRRPGPLLPRGYDGLRELLVARPELRTELVDAGLAVWRRGRVRRFVWRGRKFRITATNFRDLVSDGQGRPLVQRWH
jgi:hypothetical protein